MQLHSAANLCGLTTIAIQSIALVATDLYATLALSGLTPPVESIWGFKQNDNGSAAWYQVIGPVSNIPFPPSIHRIARGMSASDDNRAYYLGGFFAGDTSPSSSDTMLKTGPHPLDC